MSWLRLAEEARDIAGAGARLLREGQGIAYLATVRKDGGPRVHPVVPVLARPVNIRRTPEAECCSFSGRIPGVATTCCARAG